MDKEFQTVVLAALLHDIGKFLQRGDFSGSLKIKGKHPQVSADFIRARQDVFREASDIDLLLELVQRHHETGHFPSELRVQGADPSIRTLAYLVSTADNYSSAERGEEADAYRDYKTVPLASVFSRLKLTNPTPPVLNYKLHPLNPANAFPKNFDKLDTEQTNNYLKSFAREFEQIANNIDLANFDCLYTQLLSLLERYTWCVPANTRELVPDISLFDHLRTTSAIAACLYLYHKGVGTLNESAVVNDQEEKFCLLVGDFSGIQNYIFSIANIGAGGVAKRLRARSFYLSALNEAVSHNLVHRFGLPLTNIIMNSGGKFYVLLPNNQNLQEKVKEYQAELDKWSVEEFGGEIVVNLAHITFNGKAFKDFGTLMGRLAEELAKRKNRPLERYLQKDFFWQTERFMLQGKGGKSLCQSCGKRPGSYTDAKGVTTCEQCERDLLLGALLTSSSYLAFSHKSPLPPKYKHNTFPLFDKYSLTLLEDVPAKDYPGYLVYKLNDTGVSEIKSHPAMPKFMANYIPRADENPCEKCLGCQEEIKPGGNSPLYFDCLANISRGRKLLGYLKADVDYLGSLFVFGLKDDKNDLNSISRIATMSRMLNLFFAGRVEQLLDIDFTGCYCVYSGGDDLLIIGPWDQIVDLAVKINAEFKEFTGQNDNITLSAGISLFKPAVPVARSVAAADEALEEAKEKYNEKQCKEGRNQLGFLTNTIKWSKVPPLLEEAEKLSSWLKEELISVGLLRKLLILSRLHKKYYLENDARGLKYLPMLTYILAKDFPPLAECQEKLLEVRKWLEGLKQIENDKVVYLDFLIKYTFLTKE